MIREFFASRARRVAFLLAALVGVVGVAFASIVLSSAVSGSVATADTTARWEVITTDTAGVGMKACVGSRTDTGASVRAVAYTVNGEVARTQKCVIKLVIRNTGDTALKVTGGQIPQLPAGWTIGGLRDVTNLPTIPAGANGTVTADLTPVLGSRPLSGDFTVNLTADPVDAR